MFVNPVRVDIKRGNFSLCIDMHACLMGVCVLCILLLPLTAHSVIIYLVVQVTHYDESQLFIIMQLALIYSDKKDAQHFVFFLVFYIVFCRAITLYFLLFSSFQLLSRRYF